VPLDVLKTEGICLRSSSACCGAAAVLQRSRLKHDLSAVLLWLVCCCAWGKTGGIQGLAGVQTGVQNRFFPLFS